MVWSPSVGGGSATTTTTTAAAITATTTTTTAARLKIATFCVHGQTGSRRLL